MAEPVDPSRRITHGWSGTGVAERDAPFALFVESVKDYAIFMLDTSGHVITWNVGAERLKGYRSDDIVGRHFSVFANAAQVTSLVGRDKKIYEVVGKPIDLDQIVAAVREAAHARPTH